MKHAVGRESIVVELPTRATAGDALDAALRAIPSCVPMRGSIAVAVNHRYVALDEPIAAHDVIALIPPVSGG